MNTKRMMEYLEMLIELETYIEAVEIVKGDIEKKIQKKILSETYALKEELRERERYNPFPVAPKEPVPSSYIVCSVNEGWFPWQRSQIKRQNKKNKEAAERKYRTEMQIYNQELAAYNDEMARKKYCEKMMLQRDNEARRSIETIMEAVDNYLDNKINEARKLQDKAIRQGIVHETYMYDLHALCFFYKCLDIGWTDHLKGVNGAYIRWEDEKHKMEIESTLNSMECELHDIHNTLRNINDLQNTSLQRQDKYYESLLTIKTKTKESIDALCDVSVDFYRKFDRQQSLSLETLRGIWLDTGLTAINTRFGSYK